MSQYSWTYRPNQAGTSRGRSALAEPGVHQGPVHIEVSAFTVRSLTAQDANERFAQWLGGEEMRDGLNLPVMEFDTTRLSAFITSFDQIEHHFIGIFDRISGLLIGFYTLDVNQTHRVACMTAGIGEPKYRGQRVFWQTIDALLDHFFVFRNVEKIVARVLARNRSMLFNFIDNPRFGYEARLLRECRSLDGSRLDVLLFAAFAERDKCESRK